MRRLLRRIYGAFTHSAYWEGVQTGIGLGELFERDRIAQVIRDEFVDLPPAAYSVTKPLDLAEYLVSRFMENGDKQ